MEHICTVWHWYLFSDICQICIQCSLYFWYFNLMMLARGMIYFYSTEKFSFGWLRVFFSKTVWDMINISISMPTYKLEIQWLALPFFQKHFVRSWLSGNANICVNRHAQFWCLCCVSQSNMLTIYHFMLFTFFSTTLFHLWRLPLLQESLVPLQFLLMS